MKYSDIELNSKRVLNYKVKNVVGSVTCYTCTFKYAYVLASFPKHD